MLDGYNRSINYMRISLTDRCNLRCVYCRPDITQTVKHSEILRYEEILRIVKCAVGLGVTRYKITGGEPLVRKGAIEFIANLKQIEGLEQVTLTTNGILLEKNLPQLQAFSIDGINISLDTLDANIFKNITGGGDIEPVIHGIKAALDAGIKCKLNCVPIRSLRKKDLKDLLCFAHSLTIPLRFIELMPLICNNNLASYSGDEVRLLLQSLGYRLEPLQKSLGNGPAVYYEATKDGCSQIIGFIQPLHGKFCASCNRVRLTSTGRLKPCLYSANALDVRNLLRSGADEAQIIEALKKAVCEKPMGHHFEDSPASFGMNEIGG